MRDLDGRGIVTTGVCQACRRTVGLTRPFDPNSPMRRHKDPKSRRKDHWCRYSGTENWEPEVDPSDNETAPTSGSSGWFAEDGDYGPERDQDAPGRSTFEQWWVQLASTLAPDIQRKAEEYGTNSLVEMGRVFARGQGREIDEPEAIELGCFLYTYGKVQRVADAALKGTLPSIDTWRDIMVYATMCLYAREHGRWP